MNFSVSVRFQRGREYRIPFDLRNFLESTPFDFAGVPFMLYSNNMYSEYVGETITFVLVFRFKFDFMRERETAAIHMTKGLQSASIINCIYIPRVFNYYLVTKNWLKSRDHGQGPVGC